MPRGEPKPVQRWAPIDTSGCISVAAHRAEIAGLRTGWRRHDIARNSLGRSGPAALLESLLLKDIIAWSQGLSLAQRDYVLAMDPSRLPPQFPLPTDEHSVDPTSGEIEQIKRRALRRAEQLSNIYLDEADSADDQSSMELAQKRAAQSITLLAGLRDIASAATPP
jgi:hypothetical protein